MPLIADTAPSSGQVKIPAQALAWDKTCLPKIEGGLGIQDLATQNHRLLLNFVHKLHLSDSLPWRDWILHDINCDLGDGLPGESFL